MVRSRVLTLVAMAASLSLSACRITTPGPQAPTQRTIHIVTHEGDLSGPPLTDVDVTIAWDGGEKREPHVVHTASLDGIPNCPTTFSVKAAKVGWTERTSMRPESYGPAQVACQGPPNTDPEPYTVHLVFAKDIPPPPAHVDPSRVPTDVLLEFLTWIRGALFTARGPCPDGPRPGQPDNTCTTATRTPGALSTVLPIYQRNAYTHGPIGPWIDPGYHGQEPAQDFRLDHGKSAIANLQAMWDAGVVPVCFLSPDNFTLDQMVALEPIFSLPGFQNLCRIVIPKGWEPSMDTSNEEWVRWYVWARRVFPRALYGLHMAANFDAPGNNVDLSPRCDQIPEHERRAFCRANPTADNPDHLGNAGTWRKLAPYLHFYFQQVGVFYTSPDADPETANEFDKLYRLPSHRGSGEVDTNRFISGYGGWPMNSAFGPDQSIILVYAEGTSYAAYWSNLSEAATKAWGDRAIRVGGGKVGVLESFTATPDDRAFQRRMFEVLGVKE